jgi:hypothetical protein
MATEEQVQQAQLLVDSFKQLADTEERRLKTKEELDDLLSKELKELSRRNKLLGIDERSAKAIREANELTLKSYKDQIEALLRKKDLTDKEKDDLKDLIADAEKLTNQLETQNQLQSVQNELKQEAIGLAENLLGQFGFLTSKSNAYTRSLSKGVELLEKQGKVSGKVAAGLKGAAVAIGGIVSRGAEYAKLVEEGEKSIVAFGLSSEQASKAIRGISRDFIAAGNAPQDFINALQTVQEQGGTRLREALDSGMIETLARANKAGLDTASATQVLNEAIVQQGMTVDQANQKLGSLVAISRGLGEPIGTATKQFVQFSARLGQAGPKAVEVFKRLKEISKASGVEIGKLLDIAQGFDTFESAAEAATKLNIVLGTQLNSVELNMMSDQERIDTIRESIKASGRLNDLTDAQRRLIEQALPGGLKFNEIIGLTNDVKVADADLTKDQTGQLQNLTEEQRKAITSQELVASTIMSSTKEVGETFAKTAKSAAQSLSNLGGFTLSLGEGLLTAASSLVTFGGAAAGATAAASVGMKAAGTAGATSAPGIAAAGAALIEFGIGVALTVAPIAALVAAFGFLANGLATLVEAGAKSVGVFGALAKIAITIASAFNPVAVVLNAIGLLALNLAESIDKVVDAGNKIGVGTVARLGAYATQVGNLVSAINKVNAIKARELRGAIDAGFKLTTGGTTAGSAGGGSAQPVTVNLTLDGKILATETVKIMNGQLSS